MTAMSDYAAVPEKLVDNLRILVVEDNADVGSTLVLALESLNPGWQVELASTLAGALRCLGECESEFDAAIVDLGLPDARNGDAPIRIREVEPQLAILVLTGDDSDQTALTLIQSGIQDYLVKGQSTPTQLVKSVRFAIQRQFLQRKLESAAIQDTVTNALNRHGLAFAFEKCMRVADRNDAMLGIIVCDLNGFKRINDNFGHDAGDEVLRVFADGFIKNCRPADLVVRLGGDEFLVVLNGPVTRTQVVQASERLIAQQPTCLRYQNQDISFSASFGIAMYPDHGSTLGELLKSADSAMYATKKSDQSVAIAW